MNELLILKRTFFAAHKLSPSKSANQPASQYKKLRGANVEQKIFYFICVKKSVYKMKYRINARTFVCICVSVCVIKRSLVNNNGSIGCGRNKN